MKTKYIFFDFNGVLAIQVKKNKSEIAKYLQVPEQKVIEFEDKYILGDELKKYWDEIHDIESEKKYFVEYSRLLFNFFGIEFSSDKVEQITVLKFENQFNLVSGIESILKKFEEKDYRLGIITNARPSRRLIISQLGLNEYFDPKNIFISREIGLFKTDTRIYQKVIKETNCNLEESIYLDDKEEYLKNAAEAGFQRLYLISKEKVEARFKVLTGISELKV